MTAISAFRVSQIFSLFFRNLFQCIALYQLHNFQALLNLRCGYFMKNNELKNWSVGIFHFIFGQLVYWSERVNKANLKEPD